MIDHKLALEPFAKVLKTKMVYTQTVFEAMMKQFPELNEKNHQLDWGEMWLYLDRLDFPDKLSCPSVSRNFMPYHLLNGLNEQSYHMPTDDYWEQYGLMRPAHDQLCQA